jgi:hypothetical protein
MVSLRAVETLQAGVHSRGWRLGDPMPDGRVWQRCQAIPCRMSSGNSQVHGDDPSGTPGKRRAPVLRWQAGRRSCGSGRVRTLGASVWCWQGAAWRAPCAPRRAEVRAHPHLAARHAPPQPKPSGYGGQSYECLYPHGQTVSRVFTNCSRAWLILDGSRSSL